MSVADAAGSRFFTNWDFGAGRHKVELNFTTQPDNFGRDPGQPATIAMLVRPPGIRWACAVGLTAFSLNRKDMVQNSQLDWTGPRCDGRLAVRIRTQSPATAAE